MKRGFDLVTRNSTFADQYRHLIQGNSPAITGKMAGIGNKYYPLVEIAPDPIFLIDAESGTIGEANDRASQLLGYDIKEIVGMAVTNLHPDENADEYHALMARTIEEGEIRADTLGNGEQLYLCSRDGDSIPIELHARTIEIDERQWIYTIARDISEHKERQQEIQRQRDRLEEFAEIVSHDLRNPLNVAQGRLGLLKEECESDHAEIIEDSLDRMESLIEDTLTWARQGHAATEIKPIEFSALLGDCWAMVDADEADFEIDVGEGVALEANPSRLQQLLENLIRNAVDHSEGRVTIRVGLLDDGFFVEDNGPGIPADRRFKVFETGHTTIASGTGFGLAIVQEIVEAHGWDIHVTESTLGGTRFEIVGVDLLD